MDLLLWCHFFIAIFSGVFRWRLNKNNLIVLSVATTLVIKNQANPQTDTQHTEKENYPRSNHGLNTKLILLK